MPQMSCKEVKQTNKQTKLHLKGTVPSPCLGTTCAVGYVELRKLRQPSIQWPINSQPKWKWPLRFFLKIKFRVWPSGRGWGEWKSTARGNFCGNINLIHGRCTLTCERASGLPKQYRMVAGVVLCPPLRLWSPSRCLACQKCSVKTWWLREGINASPDKWGLWTWQRYCFCLSGSFPGSLDLEVPNHHQWCFRTMKKALWDQAGSISKRQASVEGGDWWCFDARWSGCMLVSWLISLLLPISLLLILQSATHYVVRINAGSVCPHLGQSFREQQALVSWPQTALKGIWLLGMPASGLQGPNWLSLEILTSLI